MAQSKVGNITTEFKQIRITSDIPIFLDAVEQEAIQILEENNLPTDRRQLSVKVIYEAITGKKLINTLKESPGGEFSCDIPISIYQAKRIINLTFAARKQIEASLVLSESNWIARDGLAIALGEIIRVMNLSRLACNTRKQRNSPGNKGNKWPQTILVDKAISKTSKNLGSNFSADDVINTIRNYRDEEFETDELEEFINAKGNPSIRVCYRNKASNLVVFENTKKLSRIKYLVSKISFPNLRLNLGSD